MALGHAMINHVDTALANGESIDFEAENQKLVIRFSQKQINYWQKS